MGFDEPCLQEDDLSAGAQCIQPAVRFDDLLREGLRQPALADAPFAHGGFPTASGKCEFFSAQLQALGHDGLPRLPAQSRTATAWWGVPLGNDLAAGTQLFEQQLRQRQKPARH